MLKNSPAVTFTQTDLPQNGSVAFVGAPAVHVPQPQPARAPRQRGNRQGQQLPGPVDAKVEALKQVRQKADAAKDGFEALKKTCRRPPTVAVHESTV